MGGCQGGGGNVVGPREGAHSSIGDPKRARSSMGNQGMLKASVVRKLRRTSVTESERFRSAVVSASSVSGRGPTASEDETSGEGPKEWSNSCFCRKCVTSRVRT